MTGLPELNAPAHLLGVAAERVALPVAQIQGGRRFYETDTGKLWVMAQGVWIDFTPFKGGLSF